MLQHMYNISAVGKGTSLCARQFLYIFSYFRYTHYLGQKYGFKTNTLYNVDLIYIYKWTTVSNEQVFVIVQSHFCRRLFAVVEIGTDAILKITKTTTSLRQTVSKWPYKTDRPILSDKFY